MHAVNITSENTANAIIIYPIIFLFIFICAPLVVSSPALLSPVPVVLVPVEGVVVAVVVVATAVDIVEIVVLVVGMVVEAGVVFHAFSLS